MNDPTAAEGTICWTKRVTLEFELEFRKQTCTVETLTLINFIGISLVFSFIALTREIFATLEEKFRISARPYNILYLLLFT